MKLRTNSPHPRFLESKKIALQVMNNRPMRGGFYTADEKLRNFIAGQAAAAKNRRINNQLDSADAQGKVDLSEAEMREMEKAGILEGLLNDLGADNRRGMAARGVIVGSGLTASGAGLLQLMEFLTSGRDQQIGRSDVLSS